MILWFAGMAIVTVSIVFDSPSLDYRLILLGAVLPSAEVLTGSAWILHTLAAPVVVFAAVAVALQGKRLAQRRWISFPIGLFVHLVLDGTWAQKELFWWPAFGNVLGEGQAPEAGRSWVLIVFLELLGLAALAWTWRTNNLGDAANRKRFVSTGHLPRT